MLTTLLFAAHLLAAEAVCGDESIGKLRECASIATCDAPITNAIKKAERRINVMALGLDRPLVLKELVRAQKRGVVVRVIVDDTAAGPIARALVRAGIAVQYVPKGRVAKSPGIGIDDDVMAFTMPNMGALNAIIPKGMLWVGHCPQLVDHADFQRTWRALQVYSNAREE